MKIDTQALDDVSKTWWQQRCRQWKKKKKKERKERMRKKNGSHMATHIYCIYAIEWTTHSWVCASPIVYIYTRGAFSPSRNTRRKTREVAAHNATVSQRWIYIFPWPTRVFAYNTVQECESFNENSREGFYSVKFIRLGAVALTREIRQSVYFISFGNR